MRSVSDRIRARLTMFRNTVPRGTYTSIAESYGVSRQLVSNIAQEQNLTVRKTRVTPLLRSECALEDCSERVSGSGRSKWCAKHSQVGLACSECGKPVLLARHVYEQRNKDDRYSGRVFCGRACYVASYKEAV